MITKEVTTLENEIERHKAIADLMRQFAFLSDDAQVFSASTMASVHNQTANRLSQLRASLEKAVK